MMSAGKIVLLFTIVLNVSVPCFGAGLFLMPTTFWNSAPKSNQFQYSEPEKTKIPESIEDQIEEPIAYELKMEKPLEGHLSFRWAPQQRKFTQSDLMKMLKLQKATLPRLG